MWVETVFIQPVTSPPLWVSIDRFLRRTSEWQVRVHTIVVPMFQNSFVFVCIRHVVSTLSLPEEEEGLGV